MTDPLNLEQQIARALKCTTGDARDLMALCDFLHAKADDHGFWNGLQVWGAIRARQQMKMAIKASEPERWLAHGRFEESCELPQSLKALRERIDQFTPSATSDQS